MSEGMKGRRGLDSGGRGNGGRNGEKRDGRKRNLRKEYEEREGGRGSDRRRWVTEAEQGQFWKGSGKTGSRGIREE